MLKAIGSALYERVFKAYRSTLLGIGLEAALVVVDTVQAAEIPTWAHAVVGLVSTLLVLYKGKAAVPALKPAP